MLWHIIIFIPVENIIMVLLRIPFRSYAAVMFAMESSMHVIIAVKHKTKMSFQLSFSTISTWYYFY